MLTMRLPPPDSLHARLVHDAMRLATVPLRPGYGGPVPAQRLRTPETRRVAVPGGALSTLVWEREWGARGGAPATVLLHGLNANARYWIGTASRAHCPPSASPARCS
jgi:hypothetical protein